MKYIYILQSVKSPEHIYSGLTDTMENVLTKHNSHQVADTAKHAPWNLSTYIAFASDGKAFAYANYLKTDQGMAYIKKRL